MKNNSIHYVDPIYIKKLRQEGGLSFVKLANLLGCSDSHVVKAIQNSKIRVTYEDLAKKIYKDKFEQKSEEQRIKKQYEKVPVVTIPKNEETVLMVVVANQNVDFLTRIVRSLKGEVTTV